MIDGQPALADALRDEEIALRRRWIHHTRPDRPLSLDEALALSERMEVSRDQQRASAVRGNTFDVT